MIQLSERLSLIMSLIPKDARVCDVGTDHGYLPAALTLGGHVRYVIATDIREKPLANARKNLEKMGVENVELRLCDGLSALKSDEADTVVVAGMGGEVIAGILERAEWVKSGKVTLILQAMTSCEALRDYLGNNGFEIRKELTLEENGKVYSVILAVFDGVTRVLSPEYWYVGSIGNNTPSDRAYIEKQYRRVKKCAESLENVLGRYERYKEYSNAAEALRRLMEERNGI